MSEDDDFDQFLRAARAEHEASAMPVTSAKRIESGIASQVSWRRGLPASTAAALATLAASTDARARGGATSAAASKTTGFISRSPWTKGIAMLVPVLGLATAFYTVESATTTPAPDPAASTKAPTAMPAPAPIPDDPSSVVAPVASLAGPRDLPDAKDVPAPAVEPKANTLRRARAGDGGFEAELALLTEVTSALREKRAARALALIDEHDRRFPNGALRPEFAGERVLTLAALGRHAEACDLSAKFVAQYPKSPFVPEVRASCVESTPSR